MIACFPSRFATSSALLLGLAGSLAGCIDPKSIGLETADDAGGSAESGSEGEGSEGSGSTSQGQTSGQTDGPDTDPTGDEVDDGSCPPIDPPPCQECTCIDGWVCEPTCAPSCDGLECGAACVLCPEGEPDCDPEVQDEGICTADRQCVGVPPPKLGFCEGALQPGFEEDLDVVAGCSDMVVFAHDAADERGLVLHVDQGLYAQAMATGKPVFVEIDVTDPSIYLEGRAGFSVTILECSDVIVTEPDIKEHWSPTAGTVIISVAPLDDFLAEVTVQLVGVELRRDEPGPAPITVDLLLTDVIVGPVPG